MTIAVASKAEERAAEAQAFRNFKSLNLESIKIQVAELLRLIGQEAVFSTYSKHDISHVDAMLELLEWVVPDKTQQIMTPLDWLLIVLSCYFHDAGMIVTREEYETRASSSQFEAFVTTLYEGEAGKEYNAQLRLRFHDTKDRPSPERDKFVYEEFVRSTHPRRISDWIEGGSSALLGGDTKPQAEAVSGVLAGLPRTFRKTLSTVCESHHRDDLADTDAYPTRDSFGSSGKEHCNIQYAAVLLRTVDLLHLTADRVPSVVFRLINPGDPVGQREWAKQQPVESVIFRKSPYEPRDPDTTVIDVKGVFDDPKGYFALIDFLRYAEDQIRQSRRWIEQSELRNHHGYLFHWDVISADHVDTEGFQPQKFRFVLEEAKVMDLLMGHNLYGDPWVTVRELVQNGIDAVRLQQEIDHQRGPDAPVDGVTVIWKSETRQLSCLDSGTGMTLATLRNHFLRIAASYYQTKEFRRQFPDFSPISRFGIGVLTCFMIADDVEIVTKHPGDEAGHRMLLRGMHGRYLIEDLTEEELREHGVWPHGTRVTLTVREAVELPDIERVVRHWVVLPRCPVRVQIDGAAAMPVGFSDVKEALGRLAQKRFGTKWVVPFQDESGNTYEVRTLARPDLGIELAYLVRESKYWPDKQVEFLPLRDHDREEGSPWVGLCAEGIRVSEALPGIGRICAIMDSYGKNGLRTNVSRSAPDVLSPTYAASCDALADALLAHITSEVRAIESQPGGPCSLAANAGLRQFHSLMTTDIEERAKRRLLLGFPGLPCVVIEDEAGERRLMTPQELDGIDELYSVESRLHWHLDMMSREVRREFSLTKILRAVAPDLASTSIKWRLCHEFHSWVQDFSFCGRLLASALVDPHAAQVTFLWKRGELSSSLPRIHKSNLNNEDVHRVFARRDYGFRLKREGDFYLIMSPLFDVPVESTLGHFEAIATWHDVVFASTSSVGLVLRDVLNRLSTPNLEPAGCTAIARLAAFAMRQGGLYERYASRTHHPVDVMHSCEVLGLSHIRGIKDLQIPKEQVFNLYRYVWETRDEGF